ncbi:MAG: DPP IV N-terminal domain-containing protein [Clostridium sp.]|nr:DPP IV N-terminal domain-containing protein [Clostridium sp.]MCM1475223.1 DPP IV N-terminal domain-containing protein [Muribaculaceae bacterium]
MKVSNSIKSIAALAALSSVSSMSATLTVEDFCDIATATPASVKESRPLPDGESFAAISDDESKIEIYSYKTGKVTGVLFDLKDVKGDVKIPNFDGYKVSEDGRKVLLWNDTEQIYRYSFTAEYYVYDVMRKTLARVSNGGPQRGATLSHDGRMVAYTRGNNIFISNLDYKTDNAITSDGEVNKIIYGTPDWGYEEEFGVLNTMRWSADDNTLAFLRFDESKVPSYSFDNVKSYCNFQPTSDEYPQSYTYKYPLAGYPNSIVSVLAYDLNTRATKKMDIPIAETDYVPSIEFDGEGSNLMVIVLNRDQNNLNLYRVNPGSTVARSILNEKSAAWMSPQAYQMVKYYKDFFVIGSERTGWRHLYQYSYAGSLMRQLTSGEFNVTAYYGYNPTLALHYIQTTQQGAINRTLSAVDNKGNVKMLQSKEGTNSAKFSKNLKYYLHTFSNAQTPPIYAIVTADGKKKIVLEDNAEYARKYAAAPKMEFLTVKNDAGIDMNAYIIKPADFDPSKKYPLITYQYNGPDSQEVLNKWRMEGIFYLASRGYIVACVDGRGTGNRDRAWSTAVYCHLGEYETADQIAGAKYFSSLPYVDSEKVACFGWSYGGYMTLMELTAENSPFKAGVSMAPVTDWRWYDSIYTERFMKTPQQNADGYEKASTLPRTKNLKAKLLIMSGTSDDNVHFYNTEKYTSKLTSEGTLFDMMAYTGFEHSLRMCNARVMLFRKVASFLDSNL